MVIAAGGEEYRLVAVPSLLLEAEHARIEVERALDVRHLQVDVADVDARIDAHVATVATDVERERAARGAAGTMDG